MNGWQRPRLRISQPDPDWYHIEGSVGLWWPIVGTWVVGVLALALSYRC